MEMGVYKSHLHGVRANDSSGDRSMVEKGVDIDSKT